MSSSEINKVPTNYNEMLAGTSDATMDKDLEALLEKISSATGESPATIRSKMAAKSLGGHGTNAEIAETLLKADDALGKLADMANLSKSQLASLLPDGLISSLGLSPAEVRTPSGIKDSLSAEDVAGRSVSAPGSTIAASGPPRLNPPNISVIGGNPTLPSINHWLTDACLLTIIQMVFQDLADVNKFAAKAQGLLAATMMLLTKSMGEDAAKMTRLAYQMQAYMAIAAGATQGAIAMASLGNATALYRSRKQAEADVKIEVDAAKTATNPTAFQSSVNALKLKQEGSPLLNERNTLQAQIKTGRNDATHDDLKIDPNNVSSTTAKSNKLDPEATNGLAKLEGQGFHSANPVTGIINKLKNGELLTNSETQTAKNFITNGKYGLTDVEKNALNANIDKRITVEGKKDLENKLVQKQAELDNLPESQQLNSLIANQVATREQHLTTLYQAKTQVITASATCIDKMFEGAATLAKGGFEADSQQLNTWKQLMDQAVSLCMDSQKSFGQQVQSLVEAMKSYAQQNLQTYSRM